MCSFINSLDIICQMLQNYQMASKLHHFNSNAVNGTIKKKIGYCHIGTEHFKWHIDSDNKLYLKYPETKIAINYFPRSIDHRQSLFSITVCVHYVNCLCFVRSKFISINISGGIKDRYRYQSSLN